MAKSKSKIPLLLDYMLETCLIRLESAIESEKPFHSKLEDTMNIATTPDNLPAPAEEVKADIVVTLYKTWYDIFLLSKVILNIRETMLDRPDRLRESDKRLNRLSDGIGGLSDEPATCTPPDPASISAGKKDPDPQDILGIEAVLFDVKEAECKARGKRGVKGKGKQKQGQASSGNASYRSWCIGKREQRGPSVRYTQQALYMHRPLE